MGFEYFRKALYIALELVKNELTMNNTFISVLIRLMLMSIYTNTNLHLMY